MLDRDIGLASNPEPPEPVVVAHCAECGGEIYSGEEYGFEVKTRICSECIDRLWYRMTLEEKMSLFGYQLVKN
jgi:hypothetical protein